MSFAQQCLNRDRRRATGPATAAAVTALAWVVGGIGLAFGQEDPPAPGAAPVTHTGVVAAARSRFAVYGQATYTEQETDGFHAPYAGPNSLSPSS
ncbi:MAG TPA: hypothetical protein VGT07_09550, partial [Steroidobacteraceae bacterium]|nr:hypothetical protein [Steroidobacteraceae bacterium]